MPSQSKAQFLELVARERGGAAPDAVLAVPIAVRLLSDQLTPVLCYRRLVAPDERTAPSFLLESVEGGERQGRYSILGAQPIVEVVAYGHAVRVTDHNAGTRSEGESANPLLAPRHLTRRVRLVHPPARSQREELPRCPLGGWFGYASYDTVRYAEPEKLSFARAPRDDRALADLHFALYDGVVAFDHVAKLVHVVQLALVDPADDAGAAYEGAIAKLEARIDRIQRHSKPLPSGRVGAEPPLAPMPSNTTRAQHAAMVERALEYVRAGDIFQVVIGQRFERRSPADPFDVYRALRAVNPSPYMVYMQCEGCILVASSPEILCRVRRSPGRPALLGGSGEPEGSPQSPSPTLQITNRPLAGTRRRGATPEEDLALERELLADQKECAEHVMLVDLGRNDVGKVARAGTVELPSIMEVERYSHVMHISSTVTGVLREGLDAWDALVATLPVGTISGAPKIRAMQIIDELEPVRRGPYGGGMGYIALDGQMDIALALRTIVVPTGGTAVPAVHGGKQTHSSEGRAAWTYHIQAAGGIVADSQAEPEYMETVNKAAALGRAIDLAEAAFAPART
ncbi:MAG TPA: chorismate-binding protein [Phycisphaerales bacterium]|nr:chorismate-binding protein [Phycisphaerales bacterium]